MRQAGVKIGKTYLIKVSSKLQPVRITSESPYGGWVGRNEKTGREVRIRGGEEGDEAGARRVWNGHHANGSRQAADESAPARHRDDLHAPVTATAAGRRQGLVHGDVRELSAGLRSSEPAGKIQKQ